MELGAWSILRVVLSGDQAQLMINGEVAASSTITVHPNDVASAVEASDKTAAYRLGADSEAQNLFQGSVDFIRVYTEKAADPTEIYTETENITTQPEPSYVFVGDVVTDQKINVFDLAYMKNLLSTNTELTAQLLAASDVNGDGALTIADIVSMQKYLTLQIKSFPAGETASYYE